MPDRTTEIIMLIGIISLLILIPVDMLIDGARPLSIIIAVISFALGIMALRTTLKGKQNKFRRTDVMLMVETKKGKNK